MSCSSRAETSGQRSTASLSRERSSREQLTRRYGGGGRVRILVAGGAGYVGSTSVEAFLAAGHHVIVYDDLSTGHAASVIKPARLVRGSVQDRTRLENLLRDERIEAVLHCAAKSLVGESMVDPALYYRHNVTGGVSILEAMRVAGVNRIVYSSTAAVYGEPRRVPSPRPTAPSRSTPTAPPSSPSRGPCAGLRPATTSAPSACATSTWRAPQSATARTTSRRRT